jgi:hypothetical protein
MRFSRKSGFFVLAASLLLICGIAVGAQPLKSSSVTLCSDIRTKALTYPGTNSCPTGSSKLVIDAQGPKGATGPQGIPGAKGDTGWSLADDILRIEPILSHASYTVECQGEISTATGINITLDAQAKQKGFHGMLVTTADAVRACDTKSVSVTQDGVNYGGVVYRIYDTNNLATIATVGKVNYLEPASTEPHPGDVLYSLSRGGAWPDGTLAVGVLNSPNPDEDETINSISIRGKALTPDMTVVNSQGQFITIANKKPGVLCRNLLRCSSSSQYLNWSK